MTAPSPIVSRSVHTGHVPGEDHDAPADLRAQRPQVEHVERRPDEQDQRVRPDQRLDDPEADVGEAPDADLLGLPAPDEHPLRQDRKGAQAEEARAAEQDRPQVDVDQVPSRRRSSRSLERRRGRRDRSSRTRSGAAARRRGRTAACRPVSPPRSAPGPTLGRRSEAAASSAAGQASDRRVPVDLLHRHRRQVGPLPDPCAEVGHHHRVGAEVVEEVAVDRHPLDTDDVRQHLGEDRLGAGRRADGRSVPRSSCDTSQRWGSRRLAPADRGRRDDQAATDHPPPVEPVQVDARDARARTRRRARNVPSRCAVTDTSAKSSHRLVNGNHAL